jgi:hypothetical protein
LNADEVSKVSAARQMKNSEAKFVATMAAKKASQRLFMSGFWGGADMHGMDEADLNLLVRDRIAELNQGRFIFPASPVWPARFGTSWSRKNFTGACRPF